MSNWPHSPSHEVDHPGAYIITAGTYHKEHLFVGRERLDLLQSVLLRTLLELKWQVQAWAVFSNHYHFVGLSPESGLGLTELTKKIHGRSSFEVNKLDGAQGRTVWYRCWDTHLTYQKSYLARLAYVHSNPVKHGLVKRAQDYPWCSAEWFEQRANAAFYKSVMSFKTDKVNVVDDF